ncbi:uncharacterized protein LOC129278477 [Lytechinus pictus]|uniref:uncharacterized protein LOC129278477 n=1 Tax=Lytechinus pictus TaxID=7653 RepID=UPI00240D7B42|nr:uncharacterized protein LOC129278477 [Lytechinus pictus]
MPDRGVLSAAESIDRGPLVTQTHTIPIGRDVTPGGRYNLGGHRLSFGSLSQVSDTIRDLLLHPNEIAKCRENPLTRQGKRIQLAKMLILISIPVFSLAILAVMDLHRIAHDNIVNVEVRNVIRFSRDIGVLLSCLQKERDMSALYVSQIGPENKAFLSEPYEATDNALHEIQDWPAETSIINELPFFRHKSDFRAHLANHRHRLHRSNTTAYLEIHFYTDPLRIIIDWLYDSVGNSKGHGLWRTLVAYQLLIVSNVDTGIERTLGSLFFLQGGFHRHEDYVWYLEKFTVGTWNFEAAKRYSPLITSLYHELIGNQINFTYVIEIMRQEILDGEIRSRDSNFDDATLWFEKMTVYIDILENLQKNMAEKILERLGADMENDTKAIAISIFLVILVVIMCPLILRAFWTLTTTIQNCALSLASQTKALNTEKKRANWLLCSMLPETVANQLMHGYNVQAEWYDSATVFFADIFEFSQLCAESTPMQVVEMLNGLYLVFDSRIEHYDVYKVETINETYMLASGLPERKGDQHAGEVATIALDLQYHVSFLEVPHKRNKKLKIRVGIHSGPVVAAVVGLKMPRYCLFGDTVNIASRMQTTGVPGRVQISYETFVALNELGGYRVVKRGEIEIKGKGLLTTYWLNGKDNFEHSMVSLIEPSSQLGDISLHEHKYEHMYQQKYTGRIQIRRVRVESMNAGSF